MLLLLLKSHVKGYTKKDGTYVAAHETKVHAKPALHQGALFGAGGGHHANAVKHPKLDDDGNEVLIRHPSVASAAETWTAPTEIALFTPGSKTPESLNGIAFSEWNSHPKTEEGWEFVTGQMPDLKEPPLPENSKSPAAGVIIEEPDGRVWVVRPSNKFAGYEATFPKGHADDGLSLQATAIKECFEESGLQVEITGYIADIERTQTLTRYYTAKRIGGTPAAMGWETQGVALVPKRDLHAYMNREVDRRVVDSMGVARPDTLSILPVSMDSWEKVGKQAGSNPGGVFREEDGTDWYCKFPGNQDIARNEVLAAKLYEAAGVRVPDVKLIEREGKIGVASKIIPGLLNAKDDLIMGEVHGVNDGFVADAWLANWDVVGLLYDNLMVDHDGEPVRVDVGGSLAFRAQGEPKGSAFGEKVGELKTLIDGTNKNSQTVFGEITKEEMQPGLKRILAIPEDKIKQLCLVYGPGDKPARIDLSKKLIARRSFLANALK